MDDATQRTYRRLADLFLIVGGAFLLAGVLRWAWFPELLNGNPAPVAALVLLIGGALRWTVRDRE